MLQLIRKGNKKHENENEKLKKKIIKTYETILNAMLQTKLVDLVMLK